MCSVKRFRISNQVCTRRREHFVPSELAVKQKNSALLARRAACCGAICPRPLQMVTWRATQSFQVWGHRACRWRGSSYSIRVSSLKSVLRWPSCYVVKRPGDLDIWPLTFRHVNGITGHSCHGLFPANFRLPVPFRSRLRVRHGTDGQTDRQTDRQTTAINALCAHHIGAGA